MRSNQDYIAKNQSRSTRPLLLKSLENYDASNATHAIDFGCGLGIETTYLAQIHNWTVTAIDCDKELLDMTGSRLRAAKITTVNLMDSPFESLLQIPEWDFFYSYHSLHFLKKQDYHRIWAAILQSAKPKAQIAVSVYGNKDAQVKKNQAFGVTEEELKEKLNGFKIQYFQTHLTNELEPLHFYDVVATKLDNQFDSAST